MKAKLRISARSAKISLTPANAKEREQVLKLRRMTKKNVITKTNEFEYMSPTVTFLIEPYC